jgi:hypothetical protein
VAVVDTSSRPAGRGSVPEAMIPRLGQFRRDVWLDTIPGRNTSVNWPKYLVICRFRWSERYQVLAQCEDGELGTCPGVRLAHGVGDVRVDGPPRDSQPFGDLLVAETVDDKSYDI